MACSKLWELFSSETPVLQPLVQSNQEGNFRLRFDCQSALTFPVFPSMAAMILQWQLVCVNSGTALRLKPLQQRFQDVLFHILQDLRVEASDRDKLSGNRAKVDS
eukprot:4859175-Amphidinium_carterae.2